MNLNQPVSRSKPLLLHCYDGQTGHTGVCVVDGRQGRYTLSDALFHIGQHHCVTRIEELDVVHSVVGRTELTQEYAHLVHQWDHRFVRLHCWLDGAEQETLCVAREHVDGARLRLAEKYGSRATFTESAVGTVGALAQQQ